jgi:hypothetical protein
MAESIRFVSGIRVRAERANRPWLDSVCSTESSTQLRGGLWIKDERAGKPRCMSKYLLRVIPPGAERHGGIVGAGGHEHQSTALRLL